MIPELEPHSGSWIITRITTGEAVAEFWSRSIVERIDRSRFNVETAAAYLGRINRAPRKLQEPPQELAL